MFRADKQPEENGYAIPPGQNKTEPMKNAITEVVGLLFDFLCQIYLSVEKLFNRRPKKAHTNINDDPSETCWFD